MKPHVSCFAADVYRGRHRRTSQSQRASTKSKSVTVRCHKHVYYRPPRYLPAPFWKNLFFAASRNLFDSGLLLLLCPFFHRLPFWFFNLCRMLPPILKKSLPHVYETLVRNQGSLNSAEGLPRERKFKCRKIRNYFKEEINLVFNKI